MQSLKKLIPSSLYGRFLLIFILSTLIVQLVSIYVFYYTHLDVISKHMARSVVAEMVFIKKSINKPGYENLLNDLSTDTGIFFSLEVRKRLKKNKIADSDSERNRLHQWVDPLIDPYNRLKSELEDHELTPYEIYKNHENKNFIVVRVQSPRGIISFDVPIKKITSSSAYVFTFWMVFTSLLTSIVAIIFFRNQIRSIRNLNEAAEKFGRGQDVPNLRPSGSQEVRSLTISFVKMKERVMRQIIQRTEMLSAVSHDLRTPLTRMKLQLEMMPSSPEVGDLKKDVTDMEKLVEEYLDFARSDDREKARLVKIEKFLKEDLIGYYTKMNRTISHSFRLAEDAEILLKKLALKRALRNLVDNAFNYGTKVELSARTSNNNLIIMVDDDGPGIPKGERDNVFKPFYRIDNSRNLDQQISSGGSGLGLSIAMDAVTSQGGRIKLSDSHLGGLRVMIFIPI
ncbi:MAG: HAMP domain-containing protein [Alphaproteobacteria bacterium]|nr:HAMP domain-containing protein [Alphaproteobacteria bacterium]